MARKVPFKPGFGEAVYNLMRQRRNSDGVEWGPAELAAAMTEEMDEPVNAEAVRRWLKGRPPETKRVLPLARVLGTTTDDLLLALKTGDISHISAIPEQIRTSAEERASAVVEAPQVSLKKKRGPG